MNKTPEEMAEEWCKAHYQQQAIVGVKEGTEQAFLAGYRAAKTVVKEELTLVQARREETPGLGAVCYALNSILEKMG